MTQSKESSSPGGESQGKVSGYFVATPVAESDSFSAQDVLGILTESRVLILIITLIFVAPAVTAAFIMAPRYRAEVLLAHVSDEQVSGGVAALNDQLSGLASLAGVNLGNQGNKQAAALATLESRSFTLAFIDKFNLKPVLFAEDWDENAKDWNSVASAPTNSDALERFGAIRAVSEDRLSGMVQLSIEWKDPQLAAKWANEMVTELNRHLRSEAIFEAEKSTTYLRAELDKTTILELRQAIFRMLEVQISKIMLANVREEYAFRVIDPATVADEDNFVSPRRGLMIAVALLLGISIGCFVSIARRSFARPSVRQ